MYKLFILWILFVSVTMVNSVASFADEPEKIEKVVVTGMGIDADKAKINAIRNAVEQVIGVYVSSDTIVDNSQLIKDEILSYSGGFVKEFKTLTRGKSEDGLFSITIEAQVVSSQLKRKLTAINVTMKKVDGESLFGAAFSKADENKKASELLAKVLKKYPHAAYTIEVSKPDIISSNPNTNKAEVLVPITISFDKEFIKELKEITARTAIKHYRNEPINAFDKYKDVHRVKSNFHLICYGKKNIIDNGMFEQCEAINSLVYDSIREQFKYDRDEYTSLLEMRQNSRKPEFKIQFNNASGEAVYLNNFKLENDENCLKQGFHVDGSEHPLCRPGFNPNLFWLFSYFGGIGESGTNWGYTYTHTALLTDGILKIEKKFMVDIDVLSKTRSISVSIAPWDQSL